jgi:hypothetical protein
MQRSSKAIIIVTESVHILDVTDGNTCGLGTTFKCPTIRIAEASVARLNGLYCTPLIYSK